MKFAVNLILTLILSYCACLYFPWWSIALVAFIVSALIPLKPVASFLSGFLALLLLWGFVSFSISTANEHILAHRVSLLIFKSDSPFMLIFVTSLIGALVAGFASLSASFVRKVS